jgi:hypothetical protein
VHIAKKALSKCFFFAKLDKALLQVPFIAPARVCSKGEEKKMLIIKILYSVNKDLYKKCIKYNIQNV